MDSQTTLIAKIKSQGLPSPDRPLPIVTLEEFFIGNHDLGSIGCNLSMHPGPDVFFEVLKKVREQPTVQNVLVEVSEVVEDDPETWPFSNTVYVIANAESETVKGWLAPLQPDEIGYGWTSGRPANAPAVEHGSHVYAVWWD